MLSRISSRGTVDLGAEDLNLLSQDSLSQLGVKRAGSNHIYISTQQLFKIQVETRQIEEGSALGELHEAPFHFVCRRLVGT
jgi:hypothetical protein